MWCTQPHKKVEPYRVQKPLRHISLYWNLKKWIQKFTLKQNTLDQLREFVKNIKTNLQSCSSNTITIHNNTTFINQLSNELSSNQHLEFKFIPPTEIDLIGSFLYYGICFNLNYSQCDHFNIDIAVTIPSPQSITLNDIISGYYLLKRRAYLSQLYKYIKTLNIKMISNKSKNCEIFYDYLNHDTSKPIIIIKPFSYCSIRIIPSLNIKQFITNNDDNDDDDYDIDIDIDDDIDDDEELTEDIIISKIYFGKYYSKYKLLREQYSSDMCSWSFKKLIREIYSDVDRDVLFENCVYSQQIMEDLFMKTVLLEFYDACKTNPNLHRSLVLIKAWWNNTNFHSKNSGIDALNTDNKYIDSSRFGDINSFHLTQYLLLMHRSYHIDKWDSPLLIMAKFLELISREELGTMLCINPPASIYEIHSEWYTSFGDTHLFADNNINNTLNNSDTRSIFNLKHVDNSDDNNTSNANIINENAENTESSRIHYSYNIWKLKKKGISMTFPIDYSRGDTNNNNLFDLWMDNNKIQQLYCKLLTSIFPIVFTNISSQINYTFRVNRSNYLYFIFEARKTSQNLNDLLLEIPFMPNPDHWGYTSKINPIHYDIVKTPIINYYQKCLNDILIPKMKKRFLFYFDGFIKLNIESLINNNKSSTISVINNIENIVINCLNDRCSRYLIYYNPDPFKNVSKYLYIGLIMQTFPFREMILGPPYNQKSELNKFYSFWGKNVVRNKRFPDGTLLSTITLSNNNDFNEYLNIINKNIRNCHINKIKIKLNANNNKKIKFKRAPSFVIQIILFYILKKHLNLNINNISLILDPFWSITPSCLVNSKQIGLRTANSSLDIAFAKLRRILKSVCNNKTNGIPLKISQIIAIDDYLWNTSIELPRPKSIQYTSYSIIDNMEALHVNIKFNSSEFWPKSSLKAVNNLKLAFLIQIHYILGTKYKIKSLLSKKYIDIIINGFNFRCFIQSDTEFLINKHNNIKIARYHYKFLPKIGAILSGISTNYCYFQPTISVIKRWLNCNLFSDLIDDNLISCLVADIFINCEPYSSPKSVFSGFLRFLYLISNYDWIENPYICDLGCNITSNNNNILSSSMQSMQSAPQSYQYNVFKSAMLNARMNNNDGLHSMYIVVPGLDNNSNWTKEQPTLQTLDRLVTLSRISLKYLLNQITTTNNNLINDDLYLRIFKQSKNEFDFIINLNTSLIPKYIYNIWKTENGINNFREYQILKRMSKITMKQQQKLNKKQIQTKNKKQIQTNNNNNNNNDLIPFVSNPVWESKKRTFEMYANQNQNNPSKKRKLNNNNSIPSKLTELIYSNPLKFIEENELLIVGVNPCELFLNDLRKYTQKQIDIYYDKNGGDFIGCKWLCKPINNTQKSIYSAIWELGKDSNCNLIKSIKILKCPSKLNVNNNNYNTDTVKKLHQMLNVLNNNNNNNNNNDNNAIDDGWTVVDAKHNI